MKKILAILFIISISICSNSSLVLIKNIVIPGLGMPNTEKYQKIKKQYLLREVILWGSLFSSRRSSDVYSNNYINYGIDYSDTDVSNFNYQYAINVGDYNSMSEYNDAMLRRRLPDKLYPQDEGYDWIWEAPSNRLKYRNMLRTSRDLDKLGDFAIAGLLIHRIVGIINYAYIKNKGRPLGLSTDIYKADNETVQLNFKFNL